MAEILGSSNSFEIDPPNDSSENHSDLLSDIKTNYESIFSWNVYETIGKKRESGTNFLIKLQHKQDILLYRNDYKFNFDHFCLNLIRCFEMFLNSELTEALSVINNIIDNFTFQIFDSIHFLTRDVYFHIVHSTQAYIMLQLGDNVQKILENIKSKSNFNRVEEAAVIAIKSRVFLEYSPEGNDIALELAECAKNLNGKEPFWINIWLKALGRIRRYEQKPSFPFREELQVAGRIRSSKIDNENFEDILTAASIYAEAGFALSVRPSDFNLKQAMAYQDLSVELIEAMLLKNDEDDFGFFYLCLSIANNLPMQYFSKGIINKLVNKLSLMNTKDNYKVNNVLGKHYMRTEDYKKAIVYFKKTSSVGSFLGSLMLLHAECMIKSVDDLPVVQYLKTLYNASTCLKKRRYTSAQILLYYMYNENDKQELLYSLNTYFNEHIDFDQNKNYINIIFPLFKLKKNYHTRTFMDDLTAHVEQLKGYTDWNLQDKNILDKVVFKLAVIKDKKMILHTDMACIVCQVEKASVYFMSCGHRCVCNNCWQQIELTSRVCPICRTDVHIFLIC